MYGTGNGPHMNTWPDGAMTPFRSEKDTNWEGAFRIPMLMRWPGHIPAGTVSNEIVQLRRYASDDPRNGRRARRGGKLKDGHAARASPSRSTSTATTCCRTSPAGGEAPRQGFLYFADDGDLVALRYDNWKVVFMEQRAAGTMRIWGEPLVPLRVPKLFNLRTDPYERADMTSNTYYDWLLDHAYMVFAAQISWRSSSRRSKFPRRQTAASFTVDQAMKKMEVAATGAH